MDHKFGIVPVYCDHERLCQTRKTLPEHLLLDRQIIQIGHWTSSTKVLQSCFTIGNYEISGSYFDDAIIVCTENAPGSAHTLFQTAKRPPYIVEPVGTKRRRTKHVQTYVPSTTRLNRTTQMVWFAATLAENPVFRNGPPPSSVLLESNGLKTFYWPSKDALIKQTVAKAPSSITWHLLVKRGTFNGYPGLRPSDLFQVRRNYWAESINSKGIAVSPDDWAMPKNTHEENLGPQDICDPCKEALNGSAPEPSVLSAIHASPAEPEPSDQEPLALSASLELDDAATELIEVPSVFSIAPSLRSVYDNLLYVLTLKRNV